MSFRIYVRASIFNHHSQLLMLKKNNEQKIVADQWLMPRGAVEHGEKAADAVKREAAEEV